VGVNGWNGVGDLFQDGTTSYCFNGQQIDYAWWTDENESYSAQHLFTVSPGDVIDAEVYQDTSGGWDYNIRDVTSKPEQDAVGAPSFAVLGVSAEWIAEDPGDGTGEPLPLANFGSVTFTDLGLTVPSGSVTLSPYSDAVEMVADGSVEALPSPIQGSGASAAFTVTYEPPGEMSSTAGTAAMKHLQSTFVAPVPRIVPQHQARQLGVDRFPARTSGWFALGEDTRR
jgi:hypothetical protein